MIEFRFGVSGDEGVAYAVVGECTDGLGGVGFLYTNRDSVSVGVVVRLDEIERSGAANAADIHDRFLAHPAIAPALLKGGELLEYGCHLVAEGGPLAMVHDLVRPGLVVVGDAAGLTLNTGLTVRGMVGPVVPSPWWQSTVAVAAIASAVMLVLCFELQLVLGLGIDAVLLWVVVTNARVP